MGDSRTTPALDKRPCYANDIKPHQNGRHTCACFGISVTYLPEWEEKKDKRRRKDRMINQIRALSKASKHGVRRAEDSSTCVKHGH